MIRLQLDCFSDAVFVSSAAVNLTVLHSRLECSVNVKHSRRYREDQ